MSVNQQEYTHRTVRSTAVHAKKTSQPAATKTKSNESQKQQQKKTMRFGYTIFIFAVLSVSMSEAVLHKICAPNWFDFYKNPPKIEKFKLRTWKLCDDCLSVGNAIPISASGIVVVAAGAFFHT